MFWPELFEEEEKSLILGMMRKKMEDRLTIDQIKQHSYFKGVDWENYAKDVNFLKYQDFQS